MQKFLTFILVIIFLVVQTSCATNQTFQMWEKEYNQDKIISFLVSKDEKTFVAIGVKYHYIFSMQSKLKQIINWPKHAMIKPYKFQGYQNGTKVVGDYKLKIRYSDLTQTDITFLENIGFKKTEFINNEENSSSKKIQELFLTYEGHLEGTYYLAGNVKIPQAITFNEPFFIQLEQKENIAIVAGKVLLTPFSVTSDGLCMLGDLVLYSLWAGVCSLGEHGCTRLF